MYRTEGLAVAAVCLLIASLAGAQDAEGPVSAEPPVTLALSEPGVAAPEADPSTGVESQDAPVYDSPRRPYYGYDSQSAADDGPLQLTFTQTADFVTNLALPFQLTPENASVFRDDFQFQTTAGGQYALVRNDDAALAVGYNYYQSLHPSVNEIDLQAHTVLARYQRRVAENTVVSADYDYRYYYLNARSFVSQNQAGVTGLTRLGALWDGKFSYYYGRADFRTFTLQNSNNHAVRAELIRYLDEGKNHYLTGGYGYGVSDAVLDNFSYSAHSPFVAIRLLTGTARQNEWLVLGTYSFYKFNDFDVIEPDVLREDNVWTLTSRYTRHVNKHLDLFAQYTYYRDTSNVVRQTYTSQLVSLGATLNW